MMIVLAILAVIVALAYPAYTEQVRKARRADAVSSLMAAGQYLERCFTQTNSYTGCDAPSGASADGHYTISVERNATTYTLTAAPAEGGSQTSDDCGTFTLDYLGNKSATSSSHRCWGDT
jgi:type IV pilus assembly protein PilE